MILICDKDLSYILNNLRYLKQYIYILEYQKLIPYQIFKYIFKLRYKLSLECLIN